jgi:sugar O-acyltransferase (sialic acid O-acetyltransferase NeuD family)
VAFGGRLGNLLSVRLVIIGAGGHGREVLDVVEALGAAGEDIDFLGFLAEGCSHPDSLERRGVAIIGDVSAVASLHCSFNAAIGDPRVRRDVVGRVAGAGDPVTLVHPLARVAHDVRLGPGSMVPAGAAVGTGAALADHVHLNVNASVGSGADLGPFATLSPGSVVGDGTILEEAVLVGAGATVAAGVRVGAGAVVGAGARVTQDVEPGETVISRSGPA